MVRAFTRRPRPTARRGRLPARRAATWSPSSTGAPGPNVAAIPYGGGIARWSAGSRAAGPGRRLRRRGQRRPHQARPGPRGRHDVARGAHPGRRARPGPRGAAPAARLHAPPLPAELRVLDARRLAGDPLRRPLRHRLHAHRRPGGVDAGGHARGHQRVAAAAGLGRGAVTRPHVPRVGGHPRRHHRGVDAGAGPAPVEGVGRRALRRLRHGRRRRPGPSPVGGLFPTNCRLLDAGEAALSAGVTDGTTLLVLGFESADHPVDAWIERAVELRQDHGGTVPDGTPISGPAAGREGAVGAWRNSFLRAPYTRDALVAMSVIADTFETVDARGTASTSSTPASPTRSPKAVTDICGAGWITCRFTHVYPDGPAPYFSILAPGRPGSEIQMWDEIKAAAGEAVIRYGGTITHHHAVGRDHRPWYDKQRPDLVRRRRSEPPSRPSIPPASSTPACWSTPPEPSTGSCRAANAARALPVDRGLPVVRPRTSRRRASRRRGRARGSPRPRAPGAARRCRRSTVAAAR